MVCSVACPKYPTETPGGSPWRPKSLMRLVEMNMLYGPAERRDYVRNTMPPTCGTSVPRTRVHATLERAQRLEPSTLLFAMPPHNRPSSSRLSTATTPAHIKSRQFSHLNSQLAQLQAHLADLDNHIRITAIQAEAIKRLGAQHASMYNTSCIGG